MRMAEHQLKVRCRVERRTRSTISNQKFADSLLEGSGFEPSVPLLRKALLGVANRRRRHEGRSHLQVRDGDACLEWFPIAIPFAVGPMVRIRLPPPERHTNPRAPKVWDVRSFTNCYWADPSPSRSTRAAYCDRVVRPSERLAEAARAPLKSLHNPLPRFTPVPIRHMHQAGDPAAR